MRMIYPCIITGCNNNNRPVAPEGWLRQMRSNNSYIFYKDITDEEATFYELSGEYLVFNPEKDNAAHVISTATNFKFESMSLRAWRRTVKQLQLRIRIKGLMHKLTEDQQMIFKRMYSHEDLEKDIIKVVDDMDGTKLDWALQQVERTLWKADLIE